MSDTGLPSAEGFRGPLAVRNFRLLWIGETASALGDQFYFVALPWLVLQLTGSGVALGSVMMTTAIPSAALMLVGGAATDRFSSRTLMLVSNVMRGLIVSTLTVLVLTHTASVWHLYTFAAAFGTFDAFFYPASVAMVPSLLEKAQLAAGNSLMQGSVHLTTLVGPAIAGLVVSRTGLAAAFGVNVAGFVMSLVTLSLITSGTFTSAARQQPLLASIREGISHAMANATIRPLLLANTMMHFFLTGPLIVGVPLLAKQRLAGVTALGLLYSSLGAGALVGTLIAGRDRGERRLGPVLITNYAVFALSMITLGLLWRLWAAVTVLLLLGIGAGYNNVLTLGCVQRQAEASKLGRVMSLFWFCADGLMPISYLTAGAMTKMGTMVLFMASGFSMIFISSQLFRAPQFWRKENAAINVASSFKTP